jgi:hypothetical protein
VADFLGTNDELRVSKSLSILVKSRAKLVLSILSSVLLCATGLAAVAIGHAYYQRQEATKLLRVLQQIQVGKTDQATVIKLTEPFRNARQEAHREEGIAEISVVFFNEWPVRLKLAVPAEFRAYVTVKDGVVVEKYAREATWFYGCVGSVKESLRGFHQPNDRPNHIVYWGHHAPQIAPGELRRIRIEDDDTYPQIKRHEDWNFDLSCMTRLGKGCRDTRTMLPNATPTPELWH